MGLEKAGHKYKQRAGGSLRRGQNEAWTEKARKEMGSLQYKKRKNGLEGL